MVELEDIEDVRDLYGFTDTELADNLLTILAYHIILDQKLMASDVIAADGGSIGPTEADPEGTVNLDVSVSGSDVTLIPDDGESGADIEKTDIEASNGVAHTVDDVIAKSLIPPPPGPQQNSFTYDKARPLGGLCRFSLNDVGSYKYSCFSLMIQLVLLSKSQNEQ